MAPDSAIVAAGVGATLHLLRVVVDLVKVASQTAKRKDDQIENAKPGDKTESDIGGSRRFSVTNIGGRLSTRDLSVPTSDPPNNGSGGARRGSLRGSLARRLSLTASRRGSAGLGESARSSSGNGAGGDVEGQDEEEEEPKTGLEAAVPPISLTVHLILFAYFLGATILSATATSETHPEIANAMYSAVPLGCATVAIFLGLVMNYRDYRRARFSSFQRGLYAISAIILALGCIVLVAMPPADGSSATEPTTVDFVTLACAILYAALAILEGRVCRHPKEATREGKKARLNKRALLFILKPYFWPDATSTSAILNRVRAVTTWLCVGGSKGCSLYAPILLGRASTSLTRGDYDGAIKNAVLYSVIQFAGSTLREAQSLVYLRVAQAAFVQLSEASFNHLHSLSLDWHLRKKLGEVIRSMDRGIAACDNLMKYMFLWLVPAIGECILVTIIFATYFDYFPLAVSVFFFVFTYITWTILVTLWRKKFRKQVAKSDNDWHDKCTDSLVNFETVKYFTAEEYEKKRFGDSVSKFQSGDVNVKGSLSFLNISQQMLLQGCLATSLSLAVISIRNRMNCCEAAGCADGNSECCSALTDICPGLEVGDFVSVLTYTLNLFMPLNFLGSVYNMIGE